MYVGMYVCVRMFVCIFEWLYFPKLCVGLACASRLRGAATRFGRVWLPVRWGQTNPHSAFPPEPRSALLLIS